MDVIKKHTGKKKGEKGVTIHILKQNSDEESRTITIHGLTIQQVHQKLLFYFSALQQTDKGVTILIK